MIAAILIWLIGFVFTATLHFNIQDISVLTWQWKVFCLFTVLIAWPYTLALTTSEYMKKS